MTASNILQLVGLVFFSIAIFHFVGVLRPRSRTDGSTQISRKVRIRLAIIFMIVGTALFYFSDGLQ